MSEQTRIAALNAAVNLTQAGEYDPNGTLELAGILDDWLCLKQGSHSASHHPHQATYGGGGVMPENINFLGMSWIKGKPETAILPFETRKDDLVHITRRQFYAMLQVFEAAVTATPETIAANPILSWLGGFEAASEKLKKHSRSSLNQERNSSSRFASAAKEWRSNQSGTGLKTLSELERPIDLIDSCGAPYSKTKTGDSAATGSRDERTPDGEGA